MTPTREQQLLDLVEYLCKELGTSLNSYEELVEVLAAIIFGAGINIKGADVKTMLLDVQCAALDMEDIHNENKRTWAVAQAKHVTEKAKEADSPKASRESKAGDKNDPWRLN
jgi:hypothetical protein